MAKVTVDVKWQKENFKSLEVDTSQPPLLFKTQLYTLTGVPPERQKIMVKGRMLQDDGDWSKTGIKNGQKLMMMGTADKIPEAPKDAPVFVEDLPDEEQDISGLAKYGAGLQNLGNTCYMNSTLQCLYSVPELRTALQSYPEATAADPSGKLTAAAKDLFSDLNHSAQPVPPFRFVLALRDKFPQFAQQGQTGMYMQQDAEECWSQLMYALREQLKDPANTQDPIVQRVFGIGFRTKLVCKESGEEIQEESTEYALKCNISIEVNHLSEGIALALKDDREKNSAKLGRLALFKCASAISRLPPYLTAQMVRFFYKVDVQQKAKILRKVVFPLVLDCYDFCTPEYKAELEGPREAAKLAEDRKIGLAKAAKAAAAQGATAPPAANGDTEMSDAAGAADGEDLQAKYAGQLTGKYDLVAVLTHKGRSADSGHYVSWVKQDDGQWVQFDDETLNPVKEDEILTLSGGGDWHMAYLLLYRAQKVPVPEAAKA